MKENCAILIVVLLFGASGHIHAGCGPAPTVAEPGDNLAYYIQDATGRWRLLESWNDPNYVHTPDPTDAIQSDASFAGGSALNAEASGESSEVITETDKSVIGIDACDPGDIPTLPTTTTTGRRPGGFPYWSGATVMRIVGANGGGNGGRNVSRTAPNIPGVAGTCKGSPLERHQHALHDVCPLALRLRVGQTWTVQYDAEPGKPAGTERWVVAHPLLSECLVPVPVPGSLKCPN